MKAIIIRSPWIDYILSGCKTWEMRSRPTTYRGLVGLIQKGTGLVIGAAQLVESLPPIEAKTFAATQSQHRIPDDMRPQVFEAGWIYPWVLDAYYRLKSPIPADQRRGQVVWVPLRTDIAEAVRSQALLSAVRSSSNFK